MAIIVTYDVPSKHVELKTAMKNLGYVDQMPGEKCEIIYFPNTTLYHANKDAGQARDEVQQACAQSGIELERCISTQWGPNWAAVCGKPFKS